MDQLNKARKLISQNSLFEAIQTLRNLPIKSKLKISLNVAESRLNAVNEKIRLGTLSDSEINIELNKIRHSLLEVCEQFSLDQERKEANGNRKLYLLFAGLAAIVLVSIVSYKLLSKDSSKMICLDHKIAILVADFKNNENPDYTDAFANSLVTTMDQALLDSLYDVRPVGKQTRKIRSYNNSIKLKYFDASCDTSGLFVNGFLSKEEEVFNMYITIANLEVKMPEFSEQKGIILDNPEGFEFSISEDAKFLANFIVAIIMSYEGQTYEALKIFFDLEKQKGEEGIEDDNLKAVLSHYKGNCYAVRGDSKRAKEEYEVAEEYGNSELKISSKKNKNAAEKINAEMESDPELRKQLNQNRYEHSNFEKELLRVLRGVEREINRIFRGLQ